MIVFAGEAKVQLPITSDYRMAQSFTKRISPNLVSEQGTSIGKALSMAMLSFAKDSDRSQAVILITDGETHDSNALEVAKQAAEHGVKIFTIGIGTPEGAPIRIGGDFIRDEKGEMVVSKLNETMLEEIASTTDAAYVRASKQSIGLEEIVRKINEMEKGELSTLRFEEYNEQFHYLLWIALALLLVEFLLLDRKNPMLSRFNIFDKRSA